MRMLLDVSKHTIPELELRVRHGKRLLEASKQLCGEAYDEGKMNVAHMHEGYELYIQRCVDQAQQELDRRRT